MTNVQINGVRYELNTAWVVDEVQLGFSLVDGGPIAWQIVAHDPSGPNAGNVTPGTTILNWTDTLIELDFDGNTVDPLLGRVLIRDVTDVLTDQFDLTPDQPVLPGTFIEPISSYNIWWNADDIGGGSWSFANAATADAEPGMFFYTSPTFATDGGDGVRVVGVNTTNGAPMQIDYVYSNDPTPFKYGGVPQDGFFIISDPALFEMTIQQVQALDNLGNTLESLYACEFIFVPMNFANQVLGDTETFILNMTPYGSPNPVANIGLYVSGPDDLIQYYDPLGPQAGLNPGGATFPQWTQQIVELNDPQLLGRNVLRVVVNDDQGQRIYGEMDNPIIPLP